MRWSYILLIEFKVNKKMLPCHRILASTTLLVQYMQEYLLLTLAANEALKTGKTPIDAIKIKIIKRKKKLLLLLVVLNTHKKKEDY